MTQQLRLDTTVAASPDHISSDLGEEAVILGLSRGRYYGLNRVSLFIWRHIQTPRQISSICDQVVAEFKVDRERAEADVLELVSKLADEGLVRLTCGESFA